MIKLQEKKIEKKDFRVKETLEGFIVQKRFEINTKTGILFWKKTFKTETWVNLDEIGSSITFCLGFSSVRGKIYTTLNKAKSAIEKFKKEPIYHY